MRISFRDWLAASNSENSHDSHLDPLPQSAADSLTESANMNTLPFKGNWVECSMLLSDVFSCLVVLVCKRFALSHHRLCRLSSRNCCVRLPQSANVRQPNWHWPTKSTFIRTTWRRSTRSASILLKIQAKNTSKWKTSSSPTSKHACVSRGCFCVYVYIFLYVCMFLYVCLSVMLSRNESASWQRETQTHTNARTRILGVLFCVDALRMWELTKWRQ